MKPTTKEWLKAAKDDLDAAQTLVLKQNLTNLAAFHCQQCIEKCFKAVIEEKNIQFKKSHDLLRLQSLINLNLNDFDNHLLQIINEVYSIQIGFREIRRSYFCSQQSKKLRCNRLLQYFFNEVVGKKNKHKNRKAIWFEYIYRLKIPVRSGIIVTWKTNTRRNKLFY